VLRVAEDSQIVSSDLMLLVAILTSEQFPLPCSNMWMRLMGTPNQSLASVITMEDPSPVPRPFLSFGIRWRPTWLLRCGALPSLPWGGTGTKMINSWPWRCQLVGVVGNVFVEMGARDLCSCPQHGYHLIKIALGGTQAQRKVLAPLALLMS
jgi:hypothetical protein